MGPWRYILDERGEPVAEPDLVKWARWFESADRQIADDYIGAIRVSTVFLGLDCNYRDRGPPVLWETMVFAPAVPKMVLGQLRDVHASLDQLRSTDRALALFVHRAVVAAVRAGEYEAKLRERLTEDPADA